MCGWSWLDSELLDALAVTLAWGEGECSAPCLPEIREVFSWWVGGSHFSLPPQTEQRSAVSLTFPLVLLINICSFDVLEAEFRKIKTHTCWLLWRVRTGCFPHVVCGIASHGCWLGQCLTLPWELSRQELGRKQHGCVLGRSRTWTQEGWSSFLASGWWAGMTEHGEQRVLLVSSRLCHPVTFQWLTRPCLTHAARAEPLPLDSSSQQGWRGSCHSGAPTHSLWTECGSFWHVLEWDRDLKSLL